MSANIAPTSRRTRVDRCLLVLAPHRKFHEWTYIGNLDLTVATAPLVDDVIVTDLRKAHSLVTLGDSTALGMGDPRCEGGWRGVGAFVAAALEAEHTNIAVSGARMRGVLENQLPKALAAAPDVALLIAGINNTLDPDFAPPVLYRELSTIVESLTESGCLVVLLRYHDHSQIFWLPGPLRRELQRRIVALNAVVDSIARQPAVRCVDVDAVTGAYDRAAWSIDRLHPSELGHRRLAAEITAVLADAGWTVACPVGLTPEGGRQIGTAHHVGWLVGAGLPWLWRRGRDHVPHAVSLAVRERRSREQRRVPDSRSSLPGHAAAAHRSSRTGR